MSEQMSLFEFVQEFPDEKSASRFFEAKRWKSGRFCPHCKSESVAEVTSKKPMPYRCRSCRKHFSVRTGTVLAESKLGLQKWLMAIYLLHISRKGVSSIQMAKQLGITQKSAWFLNHRIRKAMEDYNGDLFSGTVEVDETYIGGKERNKHASKKAMKGRGPVGKAAVFGIKQRDGKVFATTVPATQKEDLHGVIGERVEPGSKVYSDCHKSYHGLTDYDHESVAHSRKEYVRGDVHTNGIESFWATLKRGHFGIYHYMSKKHLNRYVGEFAHRSNTAQEATMDCLAKTVGGMFGKRLTYVELKA